MDKEDIFLDIRDLVADLREDGNEFSDIRKTLIECIDKAMIDVVDEETGFRQDN